MTDSTPTSVMVMPEGDGALQRLGPPQPENPLAILSAMIRNGNDPATIAKMMDVAERWQANEARKAFVAAMCEFKNNPPKILKSKLVEYENAKGNMTRYHHADLADVCDIIGEALAKVGVKHSWRTSNPDGVIEVGCTLTHCLGHSETISLKSGPDSSGGKNAIQAIASAVSYLERYTLLAITGVATRGMDDDGATSSGPELLSDVQVREIIDLLTELEQCDRPVDMPKFLAVYQVKALTDIPASRFGDIIRMLGRKRRQGDAAEPAKGGAR